MIDKDRTHVGTTDWERVWSRLGHLEPTSYCGALVELYGVPSFSDNGLSIFAVELLLVPTGLTCPVFSILSSMPFLLLRTVLRTLKINNASSHIDLRQQKLCTSRSVLRRSETELSKSQPTPSCSYSVLIQDKKIGGLLAPLADHDFLEHSDLVEYSVGTILRTSTSTPHRPRTQICTSGSP